MEKHPMTLQGAEALRAELSELKTVETTGGDCQRSPRRAHMAISKENAGEYRGTRAPGLH